MTTTIYYHKHHIIPKSLGGSNDPSNIVKLTLSGHIAVHKWMYEEYGRWQDKLAYQLMSGMIDNMRAIKLVQSENLKELWKDPEFIKLQSAASKKLWKDPVHRSYMSEKAIKQWDNDEYKQYMTTTIKNCWKDPIFRERQHSVSMKNIKKAQELWHTDKAYREMKTKHNSKIAYDNWAKPEHREFMLEVNAKRLKELWKNEDYVKKMSKKYQCKYCKRWFDKGNLVQWHGEKCKHKP